MIVNNEELVDSKLSKLISVSQTLTNIILVMLTFILLVIYLVPNASDLINFNTHPIISSLYLLNLFIVAVASNINTILMVYTKSVNRFKDNLLCNNILSLLELRKLYRTGILIKELTIWYMSLYISIVGYYVIF